MRYIFSYHRSISALAGIFSLAFLFPSCGSGPHPGFSETGRHFFYKLRQFGEQDRKINEGDIVTADVAVFDAAGALLSRDAGNFGRITFPVKSDLPMSGDVLLKLGPGDSATILPPDGELGKGLRTEIRILKVQTPAEFEAEQKHIAEVGDFEENKALNQLVEELRGKGAQLTDIGNGLYMMRMQEGNADSVKAGRTVSISYKGYFLDGRQFDGTKEPLEFVYGSEMQVLQGIHLALGHMRGGEKSKIIIPSHFAYGEKGSSTGVVPPFTTVIYEVEIVQIK